MAFPTIARLLRDERIIALLDDYEESFIDEPEDSLWLLVHEYHEHLVSLTDEQLLQEYQETFPDN